MGYVPPSAYSCVAAISHLFSLCSGFSEWWGTLLPCGSERVSVDIVSAVHVSELLPVVSVGTLSPLSHSLVPCPTSTFHLGVANRYLPHEFECIQYGSHNTLTEYIWENLSSDTRSFSAIPCVGLGTKLPLSHPHSQLVPIQGSQCSSKRDHVPPLVPHFD